MPALAYDGHVYRLAGGNWRGPDGHVVHLLTWVSDDLLRRTAAGADDGESEGEGDRTARDRWLAREVAARLGERARLLDDGD